jgi:hypothetical protein
VYQTSSVVPIFLPARRSTFTSVTWRRVGFATSKTTMLPGSVDVVRVAATMPVLLDA